MLLYQVDVKQLTRRPQVREGACRLFVGQPVGPTLKTVIGKFRRRGYMVCHRSNRWPS